jgi:hypothetical protein
MNNKGFAITGIIYTLFVIFLMTLLSILAMSSSFQKLLINSNSSLEKSFEGKEIQGTNFETIKNEEKALYKGKYVFKKEGNNCITYLSKNAEFTDAIFTPSDCGSYTNEFELTKVYSFE